LLKYIFISKKKQDIKDKNDNDMLYNIYLKFLDEKKIDNFLYKIYSKFLNEKYIFDDKGNNFIYEWINNYTTQYDNINEINGKDIDFRRTEEGKRLCAFTILNTYITNKLNGMNNISYVIRKNWSYIQ